MSKKVAGLYWYCGFAKRICFMPMQHKVPRTQKLAEYFLAEVCRQVGKRVEDTTAGTALMVQTQLSWDVMEEHTLPDGMKYLTFSNGWGQDMTEITENPYKEVIWVKAPHDA